MTADRSEQRRPPRRVVWLVMTLACSGSGCATSPPAAGPPSVMTSSVATAPARSLVLPTPGLVQAGQSWTFGRNDHLMGRPPVPPAISVSTTEQVQRLRITNGRPTEHTHVEIRTFRAGPGRAR